MFQIFKEKKALMLRLLSAFSALLLIVVVLVLDIGGTYSWLLSWTRDAPTMRRASAANSAAAIDTMLDFTVDSGNMGYPGGTVAVSKTNSVLKGGYSDAFIYQLSYSVEEESLPYITDVWLSDTVIREKNLVEYGSAVGDGEVKRVYYGRHSGAASEYLGSLYVRYGLFSNEMANSDVGIEVEVVVCQISRDAFMDLFGIDPGDMAEFEDLF